MIAPPGAFRVVEPADVDAATAVHESEPGSRYLGGGTDLLVNLRRGLGTPSLLIDLRGIAELDGLACEAGGARIGAGVTLARIAADPEFRARYPALCEAAGAVAGPAHRNVATVAGNLCLDTRCNYYDQNYEWRKAIDFCMKKDGKICWVATASKRCVAVTATDCAPALIALGAKVRLVSRAGERDLPLAELYRNDGIDHLARRPDEILTDVVLPDARSWKSSYWKLRRRGAFDFPVLGVAAAAKILPDGTVLEARVALGAVSSHPFLTKAGEFLAGKRLTDEVVAEAGRMVASRAKPMDNADFDVYWRKVVVAEFVTYALREIRGDDTNAVRLRLARRTL